MIKRSPDALTQMNINISNAEVRIGAVEQNATHRIEVIRTEMSRALHDHKERTDRIIDQLTARVAQLEAGHDLTDPRRFGMIGRNSSISVITAPMFPGLPIFRQCPDRYFPSILAGLFMKTGRGGAHDSFLRPETYGACREISDINQVFGTAERKVRSINRDAIECSRLTKSSPSCWR